MVGAFDSNGVPSLTTATVFIFNAGFFVRIMPTVRDGVVTPPGTGNCAPTVEVRDGSMFTERVMDDDEEIAWVRAVDALVGCAYDGALSLEEDPEAV